MRVAGGVLTVAILAVVAAAESAWPFEKGALLDEKLCINKSEQEIAAGEPVNLGFGAEMRVGDDSTLRTSIAVSSPERKTPFAGRVEPDLGVGRSDISVELKKDSGDFLKFARSSEREGGSSNSLDIGMGRLGLGLSQNIDTNGAEKSLGKINYRGRGLSFSGSREVESGADGEVKRKVEQAHIETDKSRNAWGSFDLKNTATGEHFENVRSLGFSAKPSNGLSLSAGFRSTAREKGTEQSRNYGLRWGIGKDLTLSAGMTNWSGGHSKRELSLSGRLAERLSVLRNLRVSLNQKSEDGRGRLSMNFDAGIADFFLLKNGKLGLASVSDESGQESQRMKFESKLLGGNLASEYFASDDGRGGRPGAKGISFSSDPARKNLLYDVAFKSHELASGKSFDIRRYGTSYKLSQRTTLSLREYDNRERPDGGVEQVGGRVLNLATTIKQFNLGLSFKQDEDYLTDFSTSAYGISLAGKLGARAKLEFGYSLEQKSDDKGHKLHLKYDRRVSDDDFIAFALDLRTLDQEKLRIRLDLVKAW